MPGEIVHAFLSSAEFFFKVNFLEKFFQEYTQECQTDWSQIRANVLWGLIWVQTVWKGYQQPNLGDSLKAVDYLIDYCVSPKFSCSVCQL